MSLPKLFERILWYNNTTPAVNETNLNAMSKGLSDVDDRLIILASTIMENVPQIIEYMEILEPAVQQIASNVQRAETAASTAETAEENAADSADAAAESETNAETAATAAEAAKEDIGELLGVPTFSVDFSTGQLTYSVDTIYTFTINTTTGNLEWEVA